MIEEVEDLEELGEDEPEQEQEMYEHFRLEVDPGQNLLRIDRFLVDRLPNVSRTKIQEAAEAQCVLVNNKPVKSNYRVKPKDIVTLMLPHPKREIRVIPEDIPLNIVYEDDYLLVINKEPGMVVHPSYGHYTGTLVNALAKRPPSRTGPQNRQGYFRTAGYCQNGRSQNQTGFSIFS